MASAAVAVLIAAPSSINAATVPMASRQSWSRASDQPSPDSSLIGADEGLLHDEIVVWLRAPVHVLHAEIPQRLGEHVDVVQVADDQGQRRFEVRPQPRQVGRKQGAHAGSASKSRS